VIIVGVEIMEQKEADRILKKMEMTASGKISAFKLASILLKEVKRK